jgi:hypothetical protein
VTQSRFDGSALGSVLSAPQQGPPGLGGSHTLPAERTREREHLSMGSPTRSRVGYERSRVPCKPALALFARRGSERNDVGAIAYVDT